jgi:LPS export ABC transporter protein LptC
MKKTAQLFNFIIPYLKSYTIIAFYLLLAAIISTACKKNDPKEVEALTIKATPTEVATGVEAIYSDSAIVKARLTAPVMIRSLTDSPVVEMPKGVEVLFYDKNLKVNSKLRANYGIRYVMRNITITRGNVVVVNVKGDTMNTEELIWHEATERVTSKKFVKVKTKEEIILAEGFESDVNFTKYTFYKIKGTISIKQE